jgi:hypothetical protein
MPSPSDPLKHAWLAALQPGQAVRICNGWVYSGYPGRVLSVEHEPQLRIVAVEDGGGRPTTFDEKGREVGIVMDGEWLAPASVD